MPRAWKKVAKFAANENYADEDLSAAIGAALARDFEAEVPTSVRAELLEILCDPQEALFSDDPMMRLEVLRQRVPGSVLGQTLIDCCEQQVLAGKRGPNALLHAYENALGNRASAGVRQVQEHYHRKQGELQARQIQRRLENGCADSGLTALAQRLISGDIRPTNPPAKNKELDDGVPL
jgi:hypothetical protein